MQTQRDIEQLKTEVILMARKSQAIFEAAVECLENPDDAKVTNIKLMDKEIDQHELAIDRQATTLLALREPYAGDFRFVFATVKINTDLERVGDQSKTIAKWSLRLGHKPSEDMQELVQKTREALNMAVSALIDNDTEQAEKVMKIEFQVDALEDRIIESTNSVAEAFIAKALERIGDLGTNIAENIFYMAEASEVRHGLFES